MSLLVAAAVAGLKLTLVPQATRILVSEPLWVRVTVEADARTVLPDSACSGGQELASGSFRFLRDGPGGHVSYTESHVGDSMSRTAITKAGGRCTSELRLVWGAVAGAANGFLFPGPGIYTLRVRFHAIESQALTIHVEEPAGREADVLAAVRENPFSIVWWSGEDADQLRARYPSSRYVAPRPRWPSGR